MRKDIGINDKHEVEFMNNMIYSQEPPNEEQMEKALLYHKENCSLRDIKIWVFDCISLYGDWGAKWKDFFLRHGIINEKEEVIYKP